MENLQEDQVLQEEGGNKTILVIVGIVLVAIIVAGLIIFSQNKTISPALDNEQEVEEKVVANYVNIIYTDNGFVPPVLITEENRVNFLNKSSQPMNISLVGEEPVFTYGDPENVVVDSNYFVELPSGQYILTDLNNGSKLDINIK